MWKACTMIRTVTRISTCPLLLKSGRFQRTNFGSESGILCRVTAYDFRLADSSQYTSCHRLEFKMGGSGIFYCVRRKTIACSGTSRRHYQRKRYKNSTLPLDLRSHLHSRIDILTCPPTPGSIRNNFPKPTINKSVPKAKLTYDFCKAHTPRTKRIGHKRIVLNRPSPPLSLFSPFHLSSSSSLLFPQRTEETAS